MTEPVLTPWTRTLLEDAEQLLTAGRRRSALGCVLTVLSVYPDLEPARRIAAMLAYSFTSSDVPEPLTWADVADPRLDAVFCSCQAPACTASWVSAGAFMGEVTVANPRGVRCHACGHYACRRHYGRQARCPRCGSYTDGAPRVANGRLRMQTIRLNQPLVFVFVLREGPEAVSGEFLTGLCRAIAPDFFEDSAEINTCPVPHWDDDYKGLLLAMIARRHRDYLRNSHDIYCSDGRERSGPRWAIAKVFARMPKFVDPDARPA